jgi:ATP-binding cassette subfamily F protein uup
VETPGGWSDFKRQNPNFLEAGVSGSAPRKTSASAAPAPMAKRTGKLSFKDQRRLEELESRVAALPSEIRVAERKLEDPNLYARDPKGFDTLMRALDAKRAELAKAEEEWLTLEEKREALAG